MLSEHWEGLGSKGICLRFPLFHISTYQKNSLIWFQGWGHFNVHIYGKIMIWEGILIILSRKNLCTVSGRVKSISVIGLFNILKIDCAVDILEEQLALFWDLVSKCDFVLFCSAKVYLVKSPEVFSVQLWGLIIYSDSLRKLNNL